MNVESFLLGAGLALVFCAALAGWIWLSLTRGDDHPLTEEEIRRRIGETWG